MLLSSLLKNVKIITLEKGWNTAILWLTINRISSSFFRSWPTRLSLSNCVALHDLHVDLYWSHKLIFNFYVPPKFNIFIWQRVLEHCSVFTFWSPSFSSCLSLPRDYLRHHRCACLHLHSWLLCGVLVCPSLPSAAAFAVSSSVFMPTCFSDAPLLLPRNPYRCLFTAYPSVFITSTAPVSLHPL